MPDSRSMSPARPLGVAVAAVLALAPRHASANPVPDEVVAELNRLPREILQERGRDREERLVRFLGHYGILLMEPATLQLLDRRFHRFKTFVVRAQEPPFLTDASLQRWYASRARGADRQAMIEALRRWETAIVLDAPMHGSERVTGPSEFVAKLILDARERAAKARLEWWGDRDGMRGIGTLKDSIHGIPLKRAYARIIDPARVGFLVPNGQEGFELHRSRPELTSMVLRPTCEERHGCSVDEKTVRRVWSLLDRSVESGTAMWPEGTPCLVMRFENGLVAQLGLGSGEGRVCYRESSQGLDATTREMVNAELRALIAEIAERGSASTARGATGP